MSRAIYIYTIRPGVTRKVMASMFRSFDSLATGLVYTKLQAKASKIGDEIFAIIWPYFFLSFDSSLSQLSYLIAIPRLTNICELVVHRGNENCYRIFYSETKERQKDRISILLVLFCSLILHYLSEQTCLSLLLDPGT